MLNKATHNKYRATYDAIAPYYDSVMHPLEQWLLTRLRLRLLSQLPKKGYVLEVGAGTGLNFRFYPEKVTGAAIEPSWEMLKLARDKERPRHLDLVQSCAENLPFASATFDAAFATLVFCSVTSPRQALMELRRVVKPGGPILLLDHVRPKGLLGFVFDLVNLISVPLFDDHVNRRTADEAQAAGLQLLRVESEMLGIVNLISGCNREDKNGMKEEG